MATKKKPPVKRRGQSTPRPDMYSKKRSGMVNQSVRITVAEARLVRKAAQQKNQSTNFFMAEAVLAAARAVLTPTEITAQESNLG